MPKQKHAHVLLLPGETLRIICARSALDEEDDETLPDVLVTNNFGLEPKSHVCVELYPNGFGSDAPFCVAVPPTYDSIDDVYVLVDGHNSEYQQIITMLK